MPKAVQFLQNCTDMGQSKNSQVQVTHTVGLKTEKATNSVVCQVFMYSIRSNSCYAPVSTHPSYFEDIGLNNKTIPHHILKI